MNKKKPTSFDKYRQIALQSLKEKKRGTSGRTELEQRKYIQQKYGTRTISDDAAKIIANAIKGILNS